VPVFLLDHRHIFPDPELAEDSGLLAVGGDLHPNRVLLGYTLGVFPWYSDGQPILWHSPDPRFVLFPSEVRVQRSLRKVLRKRPYDVTADTAFEDVIVGCAHAPRPGQEGTWITDAMRGCYTGLHRLGLAHSVEAWLDGELAGGLYGVALGTLFFGESMFAVRADASKAAFVTLVAQLRRWGFELVDSQVYTDHMARFGAREIPRSDYQLLLRRCLKRRSRLGPWRIDPEVHEEVAG